VVSNSRRTAHISEETRAIVFAPSIFCSICSGRLTREFSSSRRYLTHLATSLVSHFQRASSYCFPIIRTCGLTCMMMLRDVKGSKVYTSCPMLLQRPIFLTCAHIGSLRPKGVNFIICGFRESSNSKCNLFEHLYVRWSGSDANVYTRPA
jgi:hypothetical protein